MTGPLDPVRDAIIDLCKEFGVRELAVFGSVMTDHFDPARSDIDFLVEFRQDSASLSGYFGLKEALEELLGRPVDLVSPKSLRNPYFAATVEQTREVLYAA